MASPLLLHAPTQQPPFQKLSVPSATYLVSDTFLKRGYWTCGPSQQQQPRHGHGDALRQKQYVFSVIASESPSIFMTPVSGVLQPPPPFDMLAGVDGQTYACSGRRATLCGGFFLLRPTTAATRLLREWDAEMADGRARNQGAFNAVVRRLQASKALRSTSLPCDRFPNGYRYASKAWRRVAEERSGEKPVAVHNNFISGSAAKRKRFVKWGLWIRSGERE